jgi:hypothetical protein
MRDKQETALTPTERRLVLTLRIALRGFLEALPHGGFLETLPHVRSPLCPRPDASHERPFVGSADDRKRSSREKRSSIKASADRVSGFLIPGQRKRL